MPVAVQAASLLMRQWHCTLKHLIRYRHDMPSFFSVPLVADITQSLTQSMHHYCCLVCINFSSQNGALDKLEAFCSLNGPRFYGWYFSSIARCTFFIIIHKSKKSDILVSQLIQGLPPNKERAQIRRIPVPVPEFYKFGESHSNTTCINTPTNDPVLTKNVRSCCR